MRGYLLMGTRATDGGGRKNHGKPASPPTELGANNQPRPEAVVLGRPPRGGRLREVAPVGGVELERSKLSPRHRQRLLR